jgi:hypothetical protein
MSSRFYVYMRGNEFSFENVQSLAGHDPSSVHSGFVG